MMKALGWIVVGAIGLFVILAVIGSQLPERSGQSRSTSGSHDINCAAARSGPTCAISIAMDAGRVVGAAKACNVAEARTYMVVSRIGLAIAQVGRNEGDRNAAVAAFDSMERTGYREQRARVTGVSCDQLSDALFDIEVKMGIR